MQANNVIARCRWQTTLDQQDQAATLQDFISHWSRTVLNDELNRCFNERCPANQTWRIDTLSLDLGDIALDDLALELPRRLRACLSDALDSMLTRQHTSMADGSPQNFLVLEQGDELEDFFSCFLQHGRAPWWFQGSRSALQVLDQLLVERAGIATDTVRDLGRSEAVRKRIVWQLGEARVRRIIHLLEPWQGDLVCAYADHLFVVQSRYVLVDVDAAQFRSHTWLNILSYLLVDRGTLFNTAAFIRAGIARSAQEFGLEPQALLGQMFHAMQALQSKGGVSPVFLTAIKLIYLQDQTRHAPQPMAAPVDYWVLWQPMLRHAQARRTIGQDSVTYAELFTVLAQQEPTRMADLLRGESTSPGVRQGMLRHLAASELALVARLLAPLDHLFIMAHAEHTQPLTQLQHWDKKALWQVLLAYLLSHGSHFNRRQLVRDTLRQLCEIHGYSFEGFLGLLIHSVALEHPNHHGFELLAILRELQGDVCRQQRAARPGHPDWRRPLGYLEMGKRGALEPLKQLPADLPPPQATLKQWTRLLLQAGCWQGAEAVLEQQLAHVFWSVALDSRARHLSAGQLLARMTLTASLRLNISLPEVLSAYREQLPTLPHTPWHEAYDCLMQPSAGVAQQHLVDVPQAASRKPVTSPDRQASGAVKQAQQAPIKIKPTQASPYFKQQVNLMPMPINNAGLVLLQGYIKPLFSRLELTENDAFVSDSAQRRAVHYLQFLVTGNTQTPEHYLMLNKLLCGIALDTPLEPSIDIPETEKELCHGLLNALIGYWPEAGNTSIDGFRGNWLVRDGSLADAKDHWDVIVDRHAYDLLLARSPYSYSVIKFPWMEKAIYVTWPT